MNDMHILTKEKPKEFIAFNILFCGLIYQTGTKGIRFTNYYFFHRNRMVAEGETLMNTHNIRVGTKGAGNPIVLFQMASGSERDYCDMCRYNFYEFGGMIMSVETYDNLRGKNFYPQALREKDDSG